MEAVGKKETKNSGESGIPTGSGTGVTFLPLSHLIELAEVNLRHKVGLDMIDDLVHGLHEFIEILLVEEDFKLFK